MKVDFDVTKIKFELYSDSYTFILGTTKDDKDNEYYLGIDIPCNDDPEWRFWILFENDNGESWTFPWIMSNKDKEYIKQKTIEYCLSNRYTYNKKYFSISMKYIK